MIASLESGAPSATTRVRQLATPLPLATAPPLMLAVIALSVLMVTSVLTAQATAAIVAPPATRAL